MITPSVLQWPTLQVNFSCLNNVILIHYTGKKISDHGHISFLCRRLLHGSIRILRFSVCLRQIKFVFILTCYVMTWGSLQLWKTPLMLLFDAKQNNDLS